MRISYLEIVRDFLVDGTCWEGADAKPRQALSPYILSLKSDTDPKLGLDRRLDKTFKSQQVCSLPYNAMVIMQDMCVRVIRFSKILLMLAPEVSIVCFISKMTCKKFQL